MKSIVQAGNYYVIQFDDSPYILSDIKLIPGRVFDGASKLWKVPTSSKEYVANFAKKHRFNFKGDGVYEPFRGFDYAIPSMKELDIDISLKRELFPFQKQGVKYIIDRKKVIVGDQPGLGKTGQAIAALEGAKAFPALIICPSSLKINWQREIEIWTNRKAMILNDSIRRTWTYFYEAGMAEIFIVNYESLRKYFVAEIKQPINEEGKKVPLRLYHIKFLPSINLFKTVIVDESHRVKDI
ncbi:MAG: SNF2-related protein, partial [Bacteroidales bacterium]